MRTYINYIQGARIPFADNDTLELFLKRHKGYNGVTREYYNKDHAKYTDRGQAGCEYTRVNGIIEGLVTYFHGDGSIRETDVWLNGHRQVSADADISEVSDVQADAYS